MTNDDPPLLILLGAIVFFLAFTLPTPPVGFETKPVISVNAQMGADTENSLVILGGNTLTGLASPSDEPPLASLSGIEKRIVFCESSNNPLAVNPKSGATGLFQVIPKSERFCEAGLGRSLDMKNPEDNIACARYLQEHGGLRHWSASQKCWEIR